MHVSSSFRDASADAAQEIGLRLQVTHGAGKRGGGLIGSWAKLRVGGVKGKRYMHACEFLGWETEEEGVWWLEEGTYLPTTRQDRRYDV